MSHTQLPTFEKFTDEELIVTFDFADVLPTGAAITGFATGSPSAVQISDSTDATSTVIDTGSSTTSTTGIVNVKAGSEGEKYRIDCLVNIDDGQILRLSSIMEVLNPPG